MDAKNERGGDIKVEHEMIQVDIGGHPPFPTGSK
jgi:hypothetical protein